MTNDRIAAAAATFVLLGSLLALLRPGVLIEDGLIETASFVVFSIAAISALAVAIALRSRLASSERLVLVTLSAFSTVLALSEVSFGARLGLANPPAMYGGGEFDGGHDIVILAVRLARAGEIHWAVYLLSAGLTAVAAGLLAKNRVRLFTGFIQVFNSSFYFSLAVSLAFLASAVVLDLSSNLLVSAYEEMFELGAGLLMLGGIVLLTSDAARQGVHAATSAADLQVNATR